MLTGQVALRLGVSPVYVRVLERAGKLVAERALGGYRLFDFDEVEKLAAERSMRRRAQHSERKRGSNSREK